jgi:uncharacterized protein (DUF58 family)
MFQQFISKLRNYEIRIRKAVNSERHGNFHSVFKGSGLEFDDLRLYQYGDDVRAIDWNTSAKGHGTYIKIFKEEKEQTVFFVLDISASQQVGKPPRLKLDAAKELCGVLVLSAIQEASRVGMLCFTDQTEKYVRPKNGLQHGYTLISELYKLVPGSLKTNLSAAIVQALGILKRRSLVFLISDFIDLGYERNLKALARKHDLVVLHIHDARETNLPSMGIVPVVDAESGSLTWINTSSSQFKMSAKAQLLKRQETLSRICRQNRASYLAVDTSEDYVPALIRLFRVRRHPKSGTTTSAASI